MDLHLIDTLENLGLAKAEAVVYIDLLLNPNSNGSQIAHRVNLPKPSVYLALDKLYQRGLTNLIPGKSKQYLAQEPSMVFRQLQEQFNQHIQSALVQLEEIKPKAVQNEFIHIKGFKSFIARLKQMLDEAQIELYLQTNVDLNLFTRQIQELLSRGVRVIVYSFGRKHDYSFAIEEYHDMHKAESNSFRMIIVSDYRECLMSCGTPDESYLAIYTRQQLQISLLAENIHNAIYWHKLYAEKKHLDFDCRLNTLAEKAQQQSGYQF